jgi:hypothetical protein
VSSLVKKAKEQNEAIQLLVRQGYTIIDLEDNIINKWNIEDEKKHNIKYNRVPKRKTQL